MVTKKKAAKKEAALPPRYVADEEEPKAKNKGSVPAVAPDKKPEAASVQEASGPTYSARQLRKMKTRR
jgi:hypothetical protein